MIAVQPKLIPPDAVRVIYAANQDEYAALPATVDAAGVVMTEWELTAEELAMILEGGRVRLWVWTFNRPLQPLALEVAP